MASDVHGFVINSEDFHNFNVIAEDVLDFTVTAPYGLFIEWQLNKLF